MIMSAVKGKVRNAMGRTVGFVGTGLMGRGMARTLIRKGHALRIYNRTRA